MLWGTLFAALHHVAAFLIAGALVAELLLIKNKENPKNIKQLVTSDSIYGIFSVVLIVVGFIRVFNYEKGSAFYFSNGFFWVKMAGFALMGVFSLYPTFTFFKSLKHPEPKSAIEDDVRDRIKQLIAVELIFFVITLVAAAFMAKGIGACN